MEEIIRCTPDDREAGIAALPDVTQQAERVLRFLNENAEQLVDDVYSRDVHTLALFALAAHKVRDAIPAEPCRHDAKWIEDYTRWAVEMDRRNRGDAIPAEPPHPSPGESAGFDASVAALDNDIRELRGALPGELAERLIARGWDRRDAIPAEPLDGLVAAVRDWYQFGAGDGTQWAEGESQRLLEAIAREYAALAAS